MGEPSCPPGVWPGPCSQGPTTVLPHRITLGSGCWAFWCSLAHTYCVPALKGTGSCEAWAQDGAQVAWPHVPQETWPGRLVTQCCEDPTCRPYDETGPHGSRVAEHSLGGDEDPRADDGAHDNADAAEQAHLGCGGRRGELMLHLIQLRWPVPAPSLPRTLPPSLPPSLHPVPQHSPKQSPLPGLHPALLP